MAVSPTPPAPPIPDQVVINADKMSPEDAAALQHVAEAFADVVPIIAMVGGAIFIGLIWLMLHYITKWRQAKTLTTEDETLLDDLYDTARRLDDRLMTIERIVAVDRLTERKTDH